MACLEHFLYQILSSKFDGSPEKLPTWLLKFKGLWEQHPWRSSTYFKPAPTADDLDLLANFLKVKEPDFRAQAILRWPTAAKQEAYKANTPEFFACILGRVIVNSVTDDFHTTLQSRAGPHVSDDGPLLPWLLLTHFFSSTITYLTQLTKVIHSYSLSLMTTTMTLKLTSSGCNSCSPHCSPSTPLPSMTTKPPNPSSANSYKQHASLSSVLLRNGT